MSHPGSARNSVSRLAHIRHGEPVSLHVPVGGAVYAVSGQLWVTQEGLYDDVILAPGERFDVERRGLIVVGAIEDAAVTYFAAPSARGASGSFPAEFYDEVIARAADLRRRELARIAALASASIVRFARRLRLSVSAGLQRLRGPRLHRS